MDTRKKRALLVEKLRSSLCMASFNRSDESYDQCLKRLTVKNSDAESAKTLQNLYALPNVRKRTKRETYFSFIENFNSN